MEKARELIYKIRTRRIYKCASECIVDSQFRLDDPERMKADIISCAQNDGINNIDIQDIEVATGTCNYAFKDKNPVDCVRFYNKNNIKSNHLVLLPEVLESFLIDKEQVSLLLPSKYSEKFIRVYVKDEKHISVAKQAFKKYTNR